MCEVELYRMRGSGKHSLHDVSRCLAHYECVGTAPAESTTVDAFLAERGRPEVHFVKMDIEGAEAAALAGMRQTLERSPGLVMLTELNTGALLAAGVSAADYLRELTERGFTVRAIRPQGTTIPVEQVDREVYSLTPLGYVNLICTRGAGMTDG